MTRRPIPTDADGRRLCARCWIRPRVYTSYCRECNRELSARSKHNSTMPNLRRLADFNRPGRKEP